MDPETHPTWRMVPVFKARESLVRAGALTDLRRFLQRGEARLWAYAHTRSGHIVLLLVATAVWSALWAAFDIAVVRLAFPPPLNPASSTQIYWYATWGFVFPLTTLFAFREHAWLPIVAVLGGAWEDILFYWFLGIFLPGGYGWTFLVRGAVFLPLAVLGEIASHRLTARQGVVAVVALLLVALYVNLVSGALIAAAILAYLAYTRLARLLKASGRTWGSRP